MSKQTSLSQFFKKSNDTNVLQFDHHKSSVSVTSPIKRPISPNIDNNFKRTKLSKKSDNTKIENEYNFNNFDIGFYFNRSLTDVEKEEVLKQIWKPEPTFEFPNTVIFSGKDKRSKNFKFQYRWLHTFPWLAYSAKLDGAFCTFCVAFAKSGAGINSQTLGVLVTANGTILDCLNTMRKDNTGYHLKHLFIGSEGTLGVITKVAILCPTLPKHVNIAFIGLDSYDKVLKLFSIARAEFGETLSSFELMDNMTVTCVESNLQLQCPIANSYQFYVIIELASSRPNIVQHMENVLEKALEDSVIADATTSDQTSSINKIWKIRESGIEALLKSGYVYAFDLSIPLKQFYEIVELTREKLKDVADCKIVSGFGHIGDGNLHLHIVTSRYDEELTQLIEPFVYGWTSKNGGSVSAEHGIGSAKTHYLGYTKSAQAIDLMRSLKNTMDPKCILNPYKVIPTATAAAAASSDQ